MTVDPKPTTTERLVALDIFRGLIMFLLVAETAGIYHAVRDLTVPGSFWHGRITQFHHHPWSETAKSARNRQYQSGSWH
ncbi:MAG: hypothetical protein MK161_13385 [Pirellulales bacterium]|nr:hypothetical protein [Pirellulales bacterium]